MNLSTCCGLEWLVNNGGQILWVPRTITCLDPQTNTTNYIEDLAGVQGGVYEGV
jgi:hypothetical protein